MAQSAAASGDDPAAEEYIQLLRSKEDKTVAYVQLAQLQRNDPEKARVWLTRGMAATDTSKTTANWSAYLNAVPLYMDSKDYNTAYALAATVYRHSPDRASALLLAQASHALGNDAEALRLLETAVQQGQSSSQIKQLLQTLYSNQYPGSDFTAYYTGLQPASATADHTRDLRAAMREEQIAGISLKDINGKVVNIADLKGKIVVLDFWATWCKPCIQSFPAMQQVMQQHPEAVFLFIATFETGDALRKVMQFAAEKAFPFRYLLDEKLIKSPGYKAFNQYKVASVPYKVVLDKNGKVRFRTHGFDGDEEALIAELNGMIRLLQ